MGCVGGTRFDKEDEGRKQREMGLGPSALQWITSLMNPRANSAMLDLIMLTIISDLISVLTFKLDGMIITVVNLHGCYESRHKHYRVTMITLRVSLVA